jgi:hypothetical protein
VQPEGSPGAVGKPLHLVNARRREVPVGQLGLDVARVRELIRDLFDALHCRPGCCG